MIILGIDPGTERVGFGIIKKKRQLRYLNSGTVKTDPFLKPEKRLEKIHKEISKLIKKYKPKIIAIENVFFFKNLKTAMKVSEAKGIIMLLASKKKIRIIEVSPLEMKMAISGYGRASKSQIKKMVKEILFLNKGFKFLTDDQADALGIAICASRKI